ncbi:MAG: LPS export ABC transporter periplasmic protein LptC [Desulfobacteraceae bacterium]|nr:MAG: LPS export ABC transporter periplasmic protein LptC [Desulfobacteraceae bacterium]
MSTPTSFSTRVKRILFVLIALCVGLIGATILVRSWLSQPIEIKEIDIDSTAMLTIVPFNQISKKNGQVEFKLKASSAKLLKDQDLAILSDVDIEYYTRDGDVVRVTSKGGEINTKTLDGSFTENVVIQSGSATLKTKTLHYLKKEHILYTDNHVMVTNQDSFIEADSMTTDLNAGTSVFKGRVKGKFSETLNALQ